MCSVNIFEALLSLSPALIDAAQRWPPKKNSNGQCCGGAAIKTKSTGAPGWRPQKIYNPATDDYSIITSEAAPCPLQPCYFAKWDILADISYVMGFRVCIRNHFLPIFPISCHLLMLECDCPIFQKLFISKNLDSGTSLVFCFFI